MCFVIKSRLQFKMGHVGSKTRSLGQLLEKPCVLSRRHSFDPVFMKLCQNDFLTLNKHFSRRAMLSDDSSCLVFKTFMCFTVKTCAPVVSVRGHKKKRTAQQHMLTSKYAEVSQGYPNVCHILAMQAISSHSWIQFPDKNTRLNIMQAMN